MSIFKARVTTVDHDLHYRFIIVFMPETFADPTLLFIPALDMQQSALACASSGYFGAQLTGGMFFLF